NDLSLQELLVPVNGVDGRQIVLLRFKKKESVHEENLWMDKYPNLFLADTQSDRYRGAWPGPISPGGLAACLEDSAPVTLRLRAGAPTPITGWRPAVPAQC